MIGSGGKAESFLSELEYFVYAVEAEKSEFDSRNIMVLKPEQLESALKKAKEKL